MSKSVLISIKPQWCELIASGEKTVEIRKTKPKLETPFKVYIYCTKGKFEPSECLRNDLHYDDSTIKVCEGQGKVIGEFVCNRIDDMRDVEQKPTCLTIDEWLKYTDGHKGIVYGWHISDLVIYNNPKRLSDFHHYHTGVNIDRSGYPLGSRMSCAPQSWCYVEG